MVKKSSLSVSKWARVVATVGIGLGATGALASTGVAAAAGKASATGGVAALASRGVAATGHLSDVAAPATGSVPTADAAAASGVPTWSGSFGFKGTTYPFTMVGNSPKAAGTKTVPVSITPLKLVLSNGDYTYPTTAVSQMAKSHLFTNYAFPGSTSQYGDAAQREEFGVGLNAASHSLLATPTIKPQLTLTVPAADGGIITASDGTGYLAVKFSWFDSQIRALAAKASASSFPLFLAYETYLYTSSPSQAGIGGYHSATGNSSGNHTYAYASWVTGDLYGAASGNLAAMSHEVEEWFNDPFVNNKVPNWSVPSEPQYGCSSVLEVGDPLVGTVATIGGLNYQDVASFSFFARLSPSINLNHKYSFFGTFTKPAVSC